jgi:hypothetical protein
MLRFRFLHHIGFALTFFCVFSAATAIAVADEPTSKKIRIGIYDNRAIAVAYAPSKFNPVAEKMKIYKQAQADGDQAKAKELEQWGKTHQRQLHFQGFGHVPVGDLLEPLNEQIAQLAKAKRLAAITMNCEFVSDSVELVDVTDDLVKLFQPSEKTLERVAEIRKTEPLSLAELALMDHEL